MVLILENRNNGYIKLFVIPYRYSCHLVTMFGRGFLLVITITGHLNIENSSVKHGNTGLYDASRFLLFYCEKTDFCLLMFMITKGINYDTEVYCTTE